jgi:hypothetical protein
MMVCELFGDRLCANWESREDALALAGQQTLALFQERSAKTAILVLRHTLSLSVYSPAIPTTCLSLHSPCFCSDTVVLEHSVAADQSLSEGHCTLLMQPMSLLCPDPFSSMFQTTAGIEHTAIEKLDCIAPI